MTEKITFVTNQSVFDRTSRSSSPKMLDVNPNDIKAFHYIRNRGLGGVSVNLKNGASVGIRGKLSDALSRVANVSEETLKNIKVTIVDKTPRDWGEPQIKIQTTVGRGIGLGY